MIKQDKNLIVTSAGRGACCSTRQKVLGIIALGGLFACGLMVGIAINGNAPQHGKIIGMSKAQCDTISQQIVFASQGGGCSPDVCVSKLRELNQIYTTNCAGRTFKVDAPKPAQNVKSDEDIKTCELIEGLLSERLNQDEYNKIITHSNNIEVYKSLVAKGCPENADKYKEMITRESEIIDVLKEDVSSENTPTCVKIEQILLQQMWLDGTSVDSYISRAQSYANLAERGCPENKQKYTDLATRELEIARGISGDDMDEYETKNVVETYKRLQMKAAAQDVINKVQKITDPAIDFILELEKIINE